MRGSIKITRIVGEFLCKHLRNFAKRIFYNYYLRDMSLASIQLPVGFCMVLLGGIFGVLQWIDSAHSGAPTLPGTVMLSALPVILGTQFILAFVGYDISSVPKRPFHLLSKMSRQRDDRTHRIP